VARLSCISSTRHGTTLRVLPSRPPEHTRCACTVTGCFCTSASTALTQFDPSM
jgi:hypothetical protein